MPKHTSQSLIEEESTVSKKRKLQHTTFSKCIQDSGLVLNEPPEKCIATQEIVHIVRQIEKHVQREIDAAKSVTDILSTFIADCEDLEMFKHYLYPNIVRKDENSPEEYNVRDSFIKILLNVSALQIKIIDFIFEKAIDFAVDGKCSPWIQMILKCFSNLDSVADPEKLSSSLINLLDATTERLVRLEIITALPDIISDQQHEVVATELSRLLREDPDLTPAIMDCLSFLCLSEDSYSALQKRTLNILMSSPKCTYYTNIVKFLLLPNYTNDAGMMESIEGLRNALGWPTSVANMNDIATSQVLTALAIRNSMVSSKAAGSAWLKVVSSCKTTEDHKPIDLVLLIIIYSTSEERQKQVENLIRKHLKLNILKENLLDEAFEKFKPIFKEYLNNSIELCNTLFKNKSDPMVELFASHFYTLLYSSLEDCRQSVIAELLQLGLDRNQCVMNILTILSDIAAKDMSLIKPQSLQMLTLLDRMEGMSLIEIKAVMNLVCGLAYSYENSVIRDDIHMIIRKELGSSSPTIKIQGILAGVYAVKYLVTTNMDDDDTIEMPDDISYSSVTYLSEGPLREAAQIIELISRSTRHFSELIAFFYDEMSDIINTSPKINKHFLAWLTDAVTNDLQQNFIVDNIEKDRIGGMKMVLQYCLNADGEMDEVIAMNIGPLSLEAKDGLNVGIISPLFQLVQSLHCKQHDGNLSSIDALLGCPVVLPKFDIDSVEDMDESVITSILDCLIHTVNWFRELVNAFASQEDDALKTKLLQRIMNISEIESLVWQILLATNIAYNPPLCVFDINKSTTKKVVKASNAKQKVSKTLCPDDSALPGTAKTQATQNVSNGLLKSKQNIELRPLSLKIFKIFQNDFILDSAETETDLNLKTFSFLSQSMLEKMDSLLISKVKKTTFLTKQEIPYSQKKAEECAKSFNEILPNMMEHLKVITSALDSQLENQQDEIVLTSELISLLECLENIYKSFTVYFKWIEFKNHHSAMLKSSLRTVSSHNNESSVTLALKDLVIDVAKYFQKHQIYCVQLSTGIALVELVMAVKEVSNNSIVEKILKDMAKEFLSKKWKAIDGAPEKGIVYNQNIDKLANIYFINSEILALKNLITQLHNGVQYLKSKNDTLETFMSINKMNFPILYRNFGTALHEATKAKIDKGLTSAEHLELWKEVTTVLKYMSDITKTLENRNNLTAFFKKSLPVLKLFISQGIPIIEMQFKNHTQEILEILKILQQSTRFLQSLCCHSRLKKDSAMMAKVPFMRQLLETLLYKVKAALAANNCSEAFWMGNLKNKDIHGEIIMSQQSVESEESVEDCDDQLPQDDSDSDEEMINPESKSLSDVI